MAAFDQFTLSGFLFFGKFLIDRIVVESALSPDFPDVFPSPPIGTELPAKTPGNIAILESVGATVGAVGIHSHGSTPPSDLSDNDLQQLADALRSHLSPADQKRLAVILASKR